MKIYSVGLDHKVAPVEVREQFAYQDDEVGPALKRLVDCPEVHEAALLSTCNRTECYIASPANQGMIEAQTWLVGDRGVAEISANHLKHRAYPQSVIHLFRIASGMESMVFGEQQIFSQVKAAYTQARSAGTTGRLLNRCFESAVAAGRRVRTETSLGELDLSVPSVAAKLAAEHLGDLGDKTLLVLGASEMSELTLTLLKKRGIGRLLVVNRSPDKAEALAKRHEGTSFALDDLESALKVADIVVSCTASSEPLITREMVCHAMEIREDGAKLLIIDIAVPRDVEAAVADEDGVDLYDIDDLEGLASRAVDQNEDVLTQCLQIIDDEAERFVAWKDSLEAGPLIRALKRRAEIVRQHELDRLLSGREDLTEEEIKLFEKITSRLVGRLLHEPIMRIRDIAGEQHGQSKLDALKDAFGLE